MLKNPAKATELYSDSRDKYSPESPLTKGGVMHFEKRLAGQAEGLSSVAGRAFLSHLSHKLNKSYATGG